MWTTYKLKDLAITSLLVFLYLLIPHAKGYSFADGIRLLTQMKGEYSGDQFGISVSAAGDVNKDGYNDIIVGADANDDAGTSAGKVYIYFGASVLDSIPDLSILGKASEFFGVSVSSAGDLNKDGYADIVIGAHFNSDVALRSGRACVFLGGSPMDTVADLVLYGENSLDYFGISVSSAGDVNADGYDDLIVGAYKYDRIVGSDTAKDIGRAYVYFGGSSLDNTPDLILNGTKEGERFGYSVSDAGDLNQDGYADLIVGAYSYDTPESINVGRAYIFYGGSPMDTIPALILQGTKSYEFFGFSVSGAGDVNNDGYADLIVGAYGYAVGDSTEAGKIYIFYGGSPMDTIPDFTEDAGRSQKDHFGFSVSDAGDISSDNIDDFLVGAPTDDQGGIDTGKVHLFFGGTFSETTFVGENPGDQFGHSVSGAGDLNGDGKPEFIVGAWANDNYTGKVYVFGFEPYTGPDTFPPARITDLRIYRLSSNSVTLAWTAPGDDGIVGQASYYDLRYSLTKPDSDTLSWWDSADTVIGEPAPSISGSTDTCWIDGLSKDSIYYFLIKSADELFNWSPISNLCLSRPYGDANSDGSVSVSDVVFIINYLFKGGAQPIPLRIADVNADCQVSVSDVVYLISYLFKSGSPLQEGCA